MKWFLFSVLILTALNVSAQKIKKLERTASYAVLITGDSFKGVMFEEAPLSLFTPQGYGDLKKDKPILRDILFAEEMLLKDQSDTADHVIKHRFVKANFKNYLRQYAGFKNEKGEKIILVNFAWTKAVKDDQAMLKKMPQVGLMNWRHEWYNIADGGSYYWEAIINISTKKILGYGVNGPG